MKIRINMKNNILLALAIIFCSFLTQDLQSEQTVGLFKNSQESYNGYTLFSPMNGFNTYLIDNCGEQVHKWETGKLPAMSAYLMPNGYLIRPAKTLNNNFSEGGSGGLIQIYDWDGKLIWEYSVSSETECQHHDVAPMPNGNILVISWEKHNKADADSLGKVIMGDEFWSEKIVEIKPNFKDGTGERVWEWRVLDHSVQNTNPELSTYGDITSPELVNINYTTKPLSKVDWLHFNSIDYNEKLDQILISNHTFGEVWVIDHSTTTLEAKGHTGGKSGKGGDLLYRWGNPASYGHGTAEDQILSRQHGAAWIKDNIEKEGMISIYNNHASKDINIDYSVVEVINPPLNKDNTYTFTLPSYEPKEANWKYPSTPDTNFYSKNLSNAQFLPNGNALICNGPSGTLIELDHKDSVVWKYVNPVGFNGVIIKQEEMANSNEVFRVQRYDVDYPAFAGKDLTPTGYIEPGSDFTCKLYDNPDTGVDENTSDGIGIISKNKVLNITSNLEITNIAIYNLLGNKLLDKSLKSNRSLIDVIGFNYGLYFVKISFANGKVKSYKTIIE